MQRFSQTETEAFLQTLLETTTTETFLHQTAQPILNEQLSHTQEGLTPDSPPFFCPQVFEFLIRRHSADSSEEEEVFPFVRTLLHFDTREFLNVLAMVRAIVSALHQDPTQLLLTMKINPFTAQSRLLLQWLHCGPLGASVSFPSLKGVLIL